MKTLLLFLILGSAAGSRAEKAVDQAVLAAMRLSEQPNYSWTTEVTDDARAYSIEGKAQVGGYTWLRLPTIEKVAARLGRSADTDFETYFAGPYAYVLRTDEGWRTWDELPKRHPDWSGETYHLSPMALWGGGIMAPDPFDPQSMIRHIPMPLPPPEPDAAPYSNAQFALTLPHEELGVIVSSFTQVRVEKGTVEGLLSNLGAQLLLVRDNQPDITPLQAVGAFKLHLRDGFVVRYTLQLHGVLLAGRERVVVRQVSTTAIRGIGTTEMAVPDEVRRVLGR